MTCQYQYPAESNRCGKSGASSDPSDAEVPGTVDNQSGIGNKGGKPEKDRHKQQRQEMQSDPSKAQEVLGKRGKELEEKEGRLEKKKQLRRDRGGGDAIGQATQDAGPRSQEGFESDASTDCPRDDPNRARHSNRGARRGSSVGSLDDSSSAAAQVELVHSTSSLQGRDLLQRSPQSSASGRSGRSDCDTFKRHQVSQDASELSWGRSSFRSQVSQSAKGRTVHIDPQSPEDPSQNDDSLAPGEAGKAKRSQWKSCNFRFKSKSKITTDYHRDQKANESELNSDTVSEDDSTDDEVGESDSSDDDEEKKPHRLLSPLISFWKIIRPSQKSGGEENEGLRLYRRTPMISGAFAPFSVMLEVSREGMSVFPLARRLITFDLLSLSRSHARSLVSQISGTSERCSINLSSINQIQSSWKSASASHLQLLWLRMLFFF